MRPKIRIENGRKPCSMCRETKDLAEFSKDDAGPGGRKSACRTCVNKRRTEERRKRGIKPQFVTRHTDVAKECAFCGDWKPLCQFGKDERTSSGRQSRCATCLNDNQKRIRGTAEGMSYNLYASARLRAKKKGIEFTISRSWVSMKLQNPCDTTGIPFDVRTGCGYRAFGPSIDRIDNSQGYITENVRLVPFCFNQGKRDFNEIDFIAMCCAVAERHAARPEVIQRLKELRDAKF